MKRTALSMAVLALALLVLAAPAWGAAYLVSSFADAGAGTLREAIEAANLNAGPDSINFAAGMTGKIIHLQSDLPPITDPGTTINGDIDANGKPDVALSGDQAGISNGLYVQSDNNVINGLCINSCAYGLSISGTTAHHNTVTSCYLGTNLAGTSISPNENYGLYINYARDTTIGGTTSSTRNLISGNYGGGVYATRSPNLRLQALYCGTNALGTARLPNMGYGVYLQYCTGLKLGNTIAGARNLISGNFSTAVYASYCTSLQAVNTYIGTNAAGTGTLSNSSYGMYLYACNSASIGGTTTLSANLLSGNASSGIYANNCYNGPTIRGNKIGCNASATATLPNSGSGIYLSSCLKPQIGGSDATARNIVSGNDSSGVYLSDCGDAKVQGNFIGVDKTGKKDLRNAGEGVSISNSQNCTVGGAVSGECNVICSGGTGIQVQSSRTSNVTVTLNFVGYGSDGTTALPCGSGITASSACRNVSVGATGKGNRILSEGTGIYFWRPGSGCHATGNRIGAPVGTTAYGSTGIDVQYGAPRLDSNTIYQQSSYGLNFSGRQATPVVVGNSVRKCGTGIQISNLARPNLGDRGNTPTDDNGLNSFTGNLGYDISNSTPWALKAEGNTFISTSAEVIDARCIYDQLDWASYGRVDYTPLRSGAPTAPAPAAAMTVAALPTRSGGAQITVNLTAAAELQAEIVNVAGRPVRCWPAALGTVGVNTLLWDGKSPNGLPVPSGVYLVSVTSRADGGLQQTQMARVAIAR